MIKLKRIVGLSLAVLMGVGVVSPYIPDVLQLNADGGTDMQFNITGGYVDYSSSNGDSFTLEGNETITNAKGIHGTVSIPVEATVNSIKINDTAIDTGSRKFEVVFGNTKTVDIDLTGSEGSLESDGTPSEEVDDGIRIETGYSDGTTEVRDTSGNLMESSEEEGTEESKDEEIKENNESLVSSIIDESVLSNVGLITHEFSDDVPDDVIHGYLEPKEYSYVDLISLKETNEGESKDNYFAVRFGSYNVDNMKVKIYAYEVPNNLKINTYDYTWLLECNRLNDSDSIKLFHEDFFNQDFGFSIVDKTQDELIRLNVEENRYNQMSFECPITQDNVILIAIAEDSSGNILDISPYLNISVNEEVVETIENTNTLDYSENFSDEDSVKYLEIQDRLYYENNNQLWLKKDDFFLSSFSFNNTFEPEVNNLWTDDSLYPGYLESKEFTSKNSKGKPILYKGKYDSTGGVYNRHGEGTYYGRTREYITSTNSQIGGLITAFYSSNYADKDGYWCGCIDHTAPALSSGYYDVDWYYNQIGDYKYWVGISIPEDCCYVPGLSYYNNNESGFLGYQRVGLCYREYSPRKEPTYLTITKYWEDNGTNRPYSIPITLYKDGSVHITTTMDSSCAVNDDTWRMTFWDSESSGPKGYQGSKWGYVYPVDSMYKIDSNGKEHTWDARETSIPYGYSSDTGGYIWDWSQVYYNDIEGWTGSVTNRQKDNKLYLQKSPDQGDYYVADNPNYSLGGAVYGVYNTPYNAENNINCITTLTTDSSGNTNTVELDPALYYVKELSPSQGYYLDDDIHEIDMREYQSEPYVVYSKEPVKFDPVYWSIKKSTNPNKESMNSANGSTLGKAKFRVTFYACPAQDGIDEEWAKSWCEAYGTDKSVYTWIFETDENGYCVTDNKHMVSGPTLWINGFGDIVFPEGILVLQEETPPDGALTNNLKVVRVINENMIDSGNVVYEYNIVDEPIDITIEKYQQDTDYVVKDIVFKHESPNGNVETDTTDENGRVVFSGLVHGHHRVWEESVTDGFAVNGNVIEFDVTEDNEIKVTSTPKETDTWGIVETEVKDMYDETDTYIGNTMNVTFNNKPSLYQLDIHKINDHDLKLKGAEFTLYSNEDCTDIVDTQVSDSMGNLIFNGLVPFKDYYLKETKAPTGYRIPINDDGSDIVYHIKTESYPTQDSFEAFVGSDHINQDVNEGTVCIKGTKADREVHLTVVNPVGAKLPKTGSMGTLLLIVSGLVLVLGGVMIKRKRI